MSAADDPPLPEASPAAATARLPRCDLFFGSGVPPSQQVRHTNLIVLGGKHVKPPTTSSTNRQLLSVLPSWLRIRFRNSRNSSDPEHAAKARSLCFFVNPSLGWLFCLARWMQTSTALVRTTCVWTSKLWPFEQKPKVFLPGDHDDADPASSRPRDCCGSSKLRGSSSSSVGPHTLSAHSAGSVARSKDSSKFLGVQGARGSLSPPSPIEK